MKEPNFTDNGFLSVSSKSTRFYKLAIELAESIKLFDEDAYISVFVSHE